MTSLIHVADRVLNRPLLIAPEKAQVILSVLAGRIGITSPDASRFEGDQEPQRDSEGNIITDRWGNPRMAPYKVSNGVAIITITGSLVNRGAWIGASSGLTSYEGVGHQLKTAMADDSVHGVILDMHSPGGEAVGAFETAALVRTLAARKRTIAVVNGMAASAAYAIASGASEIVTTETGVSGSIGVVLLHADFSRNLDREGITPTLIHAGAHKVDGNPFEPLSEEVKADLQAEVDGFYAAFLKTVSQGRGNRLTVAGARKTEARTLIGQAAVDAGLADRLGTFESVLAGLTRASGRTTTVQKRRPSMDASEQPGADTMPGMTQAEHERAIAAARSEGETSGRTIGAQEERTRLAGILTCANAQGREAAAIEMALDEETSFTAATADKMLARLPNPAAASASSPASLANRQLPVGETDALGGIDQPAASGGRLLALAKRTYGDQTDAR
jgi:signal peptide peptidase SppA